MDWKPGNTWQKAPLWGEFAVEMEVDGSSCIENKMELTYFLSKERNGDL